MGVQGLTTYVERNRNFLQDVRFRDSRLVIDGCSLYFRLYFNHGLDQQHGGDYDAFACLLTQFLSALEACNIQPYVILDGGVDPSDKKFSTLRHRLQSKIKEADSLSRGRNGSVLPILTRDVFIQVLLERGVPLVQCPAEADWDIACLAHQWNCPVLTNDSDFYIFDLPGGYLPLSSFQWTHLNGKASQRYITARRYTTNSLCRLYGGLNKELLPLCAVLTGNDYGTPKDADTLLAVIDSRALGRHGKGKGSGSRIDSILLWLSTFSSPAEALEEVSRLMGEDCRDGGGRGKKGGLSSQLWNGMQEYYLSPQSSLARWFSTKALHGGLLPGLPGCLSLAAARGMLPPLVVDALVMRRVLLIPQVENSKLASSHSCAKAIRQAVYGILLQAGDVRGQGDISQGSGGGKGRGGRGRGCGQVSGGSGQHGGSRAASATTVQAQGFEPPVLVEEYDRLELSLKKNQVETHQTRTSIHLDTLDQAPAAVRIAVLLEILGTKESALAPLPLHLRLAVAVTGFWLREAKPTPSQPQLQALVLGFVYGELSLNNQPGAAYYQHTVPQLNWAAESQVWAGLDQLRVRPGERRGLDVGATHSFSQWQACLWSALCLNQLLLLPLPEPHLAWLFSGTLVHGLLRHLKGGRAPESLLSGGFLSGQLYSCLLDAVRNCSSKANPSSLAAGTRGRSRGRGGGRGQGRRGRGGGGGGGGGGRGRGRGARGGGRGTEEVNNRFALLMSEEEFDDD